MKIAILVFVFLSFPALVFAGTLYVPTQYPTIQDAINASVNGDTILVEPGIYVESINFGGRAIVVVSEQGPHVTTIDGNQAGEVVQFRNGEGPASVLEGFTITNGSSYGIYCNGSSPTIVNNIVSANTGYGLYCYQAASISVKGNRFSANTDKGIYCWYSDNAVIADNRLIGNGNDGIYCRNSLSATLSGNVISGNGNKGIYCWYSDTVTMTGNRITAGADDGIYCRNSLSAGISNNLVAGNSGCGIFAWYSDTARVEHNTIIGNGESGIYCRDSFSMEITNTIIRDNVNAEIYVFGGSPTVTCCNIEGGYQGTGNFDLDPLFADSARNDYHLTFNSPCRDAGVNLPGPQIDFEGDPRIIAGNADVGADEYYHHLYTIGDLPPGAVVDIKAVGIPGQPVRLALGASVLPAPVATSYGMLYLPLPPKALFGIGNIPADGILVYPATIPTYWAPGSTHPFQALIGPIGGPRTRLSNLLLLEVE